MKVFFLFFLFYRMWRSRFSGKPLINIEQSIQLHQGKRKGRAQQPLSTQKHLHARKQATKQAHGVDKVPLSSTFKFHEWLSELVNEWGAMISLWQDLATNWCLDWQKRTEMQELNSTKSAIKSVGVKHEEWREPEVGVTTDDKASHEAGDRGLGGGGVSDGTQALVSIQRPRQPWQNTAALTRVTYRFGRGRNVLDNHLALGAQVLFAQRRFAILVQVHVLLRTHTGEKEGRRWREHMKK